MPPAVPKEYLTPEQYEAIEERSEIRHEYYRGEMFAMAGTSENYSLIAGNLARALGNTFENRPCKVYQSDMRVKVRETGLYTYPDVVAVCGSAQFDHAKKTTLTNPLLVVEVLSPSTEVYDRTTKLDHYKTIPSLREIVLVAQDRVRIDLLRRVESDWVWESITDPGGSLHLESVGCDIPVSRIDDRVELADSTVLRRVFGDED